MSVPRSRNSQRRNDASFSHLKGLLTQLAPKIISFCTAVALQRRPRDEHQQILFPDKQQPKPALPIDKSLLKDYPQQCSYQFYLSRCSLFIDNSHLNLLRVGKSIPYKFRELGYGELLGFARQVGSCDPRFLIVVTDENWLIVAHLCERKFSKFNMSTASCEDSICASVFKEYIFVCSTHECTILRLQNYNQQSTPVAGDSSSKAQSAQRKQQLGLIQVGTLRLSTDRVSLCEAIEWEGLFHIFFLNPRSLSVCKSQSGLIAFDSKSQRMHSETEQLTNLRVHPHFTNKKVLVTVSSRNNITVFYYRCDGTFVLAHQLRNTACPWNNGGQIVQSNIISYIERHQYVLIATTFSNRLYFVRLWSDYCECSRRVKFSESVETVSDIGDQGLLVVLKAKDGLKVLLTLEKSIVSFEYSVNANLFPKYELFVNVDRRSLSTHNQLTHSMLTHNYKAEEMWIANKQQIIRVTVSSWQQIYEEMSHTENIQLLKFLVLLKTMSSPLIRKPNRFDGLDYFFPDHSAEAQKILLEYYQVMGLTPSLEEIRKSPRLLVPFILQHQIDNLSESVKEFLTGYWLEKDERLVEEMIIGGSSYGWEIAVSKGWVRAFKAMVEQGMELELPVIKLSSMMIAEMKIVFETDQLGFGTDQLGFDTDQLGFETDKSSSRLMTEKSDRKKQAYLSEKGQEHCEHLIDYTLVALASLQEENTQRGQDNLQQFLVTILKPVVWENEIRYLPSKAVRIISAIFANTQRIRLINSYPLKCFLDCHQQFMHLHLGKRLSISEIIVAHMSQTYLEANPIVLGQGQPELLQEHCKLLFIKFKELKKATNKAQSLIATIALYREEALQREEEPERQLPSTTTKLVELYKDYFEFSKDYLKDMLLFLASDDEDRFEQVIKSKTESYERKRSEQEQQLEREDFLVHIWRKIYLKLLIERQEQEHNAAMHSHKEIKQLLTSIEIVSYKSHLLLAEVMMSLDYKGDYTIKIFRQLLLCSPANRTHIFVWLKIALRCSPLLKEQVIFNLKSLIESSQEETRLLLCEYFQGEEQYIIRKIDNDPALQLEYVELLLKDAVEELDQYYTNLHIRLVLNLQPHRVIRVLQKAECSESVKYQHSEVLRMTLNAPEFTQRKEILAYLYEKQGVLMLSLQIRLHTIEQLLRSYMQASDRKNNSLGGQVLMEPFSPQNLNSRHLLQGNVLQGNVLQGNVLQGNVLQGNFLSENMAQINLWEVQQSKRENIFAKVSTAMSSGYAINTEILGFSQAIMRKHRQLVALIFRQLKVQKEYILICLEKLNGLLHEVMSTVPTQRECHQQTAVFLLGTFIVEVFERGHLQELSQWIKTTPTKLYLWQVKQYLLKGYNKYLSQSVIIENALLISRRSLVQLIRLSCQRLETCASCDSVCGVCQQSFKGFASSVVMEALLFSCGHIYHQQCIEEQEGEDECWLCIQEHQYESMIQNSALNLVNLLQMLKAKRSNVREVNKQKRRQKEDVAGVQLRRRTNRMGIYDKKVTALQNQAQIIDVKLTILEYYKLQTAEQSKDRAMNSEPGRHTK